MAQQNTGGGGPNPGGNPGGQNQQQGNKKQQQNWPKCPQCGIRPLPKDKEACPVCQPVYRIDAEATWYLTATGQKKWELVVETYQNDVETKISFAVDINSTRLFIVRADKKKYWRADGLAVISLDCSDHDRKAGFRIIGGPAHIKEIIIPGEKPTGFKPAKPDVGKGFWDNLLKGLRG